MTALDQIRAIVICDPRLMQALATIVLATIATERELFEVVIALAATYGLEIDLTQLEAAANANRRAWLERRIAL